MEITLVDSKETTLNHARLEVRLNRRYLPGSGPDLPKPRLMLPRDTDAYIVDRILMPSPGLAKDGKPLPKQMMYVVGWTSQPAARINVPVMKILDYVAPHVMEQWEYEAELRLEAKREAKEVAEMLGKTEEIPKRKPGRPKSQAKMESAMTVVASDTDEATSERPKTGPMNLFTPTKRKFSDFADTPDFGYSPVRQPDLAPTSAALALDVFAQEEESYLDITGMPDDDWTESDMDRDTPELPADTPLMSRQQRPSSAPVFEYWQPTDTPAHVSRPMNANIAIHKPQPSNYTPPGTTAKEKEPIPSDVDDGPYIEAVEGVKIEESSGGKRLRIFQVRWKGSALSGERKTWEYEMDVPPKLIESYLTQVEASSPVRPSAPLRQTTLSWPSKPKPAP